MEQPIDNFSKLELEIGREKVKLKGIENTLNTRNYSYDGMSIFTLRRSLLQVSWICHVIYQAPSKYFDGRKYHWGFTYKIRKWRCVYLHTHYILFMLFRLSGTLWECLSCAQRITLDPTTNNTLRSCYWLLIVKKLLLHITKSLMKLLDILYLFHPHYWNNFH